ncbi:hypothetical protein K493DRAFT_317462 [Basidiobolus meristosporus CBS 931.73]|uniref:Mini-chromosome maintenance complex-binding protein n=1 Tax=Basidiobolus meristosporus CBS 931.73 TaxID=1314790 RepID=A0A1Y1XZK9_9FUNG|nr:hypothetical protein K493DRAFT_317462 [Basidiobolus meristosporus CBS 931.73]|eukprot:ORX91169.1 hypothetical protein K493DRAFT_317462 [Basidiobolus meristosporus CBS 931.73]
MVSSETLEFINNPLEVLQKVFEAAWGNGQYSSSSSGFTEYFNSIFNTEEKVRQIPSLTYQTTTQLSRNTLVRFRGMVQDTSLGQECFIDVLESTDKSNGGKVYHCHRFTDVDLEEETEQFVRHFDSPNNRVDEKQLFFCVTIPGETTWAKNQAETIYPFPQEDHLPVLVKVYGNEEGPKVGEIVEFIGVYTPPTPSTATPNTMNADFGVNESPVDATSVPCLHTIVYRKIDEKTVPESRVAELRQEAESIRSKLIEYLASSLGGDQLAAEFLLLQLMSYVHTRKSGLCLGNLSLNICKVPDTLPEGATSSGVPLKSFTSNLANVLTSVLPKFYTLPLALSLLNNNSFTPKSDEFLKSGMLQVPDGTTLLIDETALDEGNLNDSGVRNINELHSILQTQELTYVFPYYEMKFPVNIGLIVLSNAKTFLPVDCVVPLEPTSATPFAVDECLLEKFRAYLMAFRHTDYNIPEHISQVLQEDFVKRRQEAYAAGQELMSQGDMLFLLTLARLHIWKYTVELNESRKQRVNGLPSRQATTPTLNR